MVSKVLSYATLAGSLITQSPQIYKIVKAQSAAGLSTLSWVLSTCGSALTITYNVRMGNPFTTWGEQLFVAVQVVILILIKRHYDGQSVAGSIAGLIVLTLLLVVCMHDITPAWLLISLPVPLSCSASLPQIMTNVRNGNTGQLSMFPAALAVIGLSIRIFTTLTEIDDRLLLLSIAVPCIMNVVLVTQFTIYPDGDTAAKLAQKAD